MTLLPFTDCCLLLGVDPKTLRRWLTSAHLSCTRHPTDARLKCLTSSQLQQLAQQYDRFLPDPLPAQTQHPASSDADAFLPPNRPLGPVAPPAPAPEAELRHQFTLLQAQVTSLQEHVTQLALALVREQQWHWDLRVASSQSSLPAPLISSPQTPKVSTPSKVHRNPTMAEATPSPEAKPPRSRALTLIEQGIDGQYVVISPTQGVLALTPDSPAWFDWLASLTSFTFRCHHGSFSATRKYRNRQRIHAWNVHRSMHGRSCSLSLGLTSALTIARLEQMALAVQTRLTAL